MTDPRRIESGRPVAARPGREQRMGAVAGQWRGERRLEPRDQFREVTCDQGTCVIWGQVLRGAAKDVDVTARTTSLAISAYPASFG